MTSTLFTWGYYGWGNCTPQLVEAVDTVETSRGFEPPIFVDIRVRRNVRAKGFVGNAFEKLLGPSRHRWMKSLGNKFIQTRTGPDIQIADPSTADELLDLALESAGANNVFFSFAVASGQCAMARSLAIEPPWPGWCGKRRAAWQLGRDRGVARRGAKAD